MSRHFQNTATVSAKEDEFSKEWTDTFHIPVDFLETGGSITVQTQGQSHQWKDADWTTLLLLDRGKVGAYIGVNDPSELPPNYSVHLRFQYLLVDAKGQGILEGPPTETIMQRSDDNTRVDNGFSMTFSNIEFVKHLRKQFAVMQTPGATTIPVRLKLVVEECIQLAQLPDEHNCKRDTGMVGITKSRNNSCLNALLQVLYHINGFRRVVYKLPHEGEVISSSTTLALQNVFRNLQTSDCETSTKEIGPALGWTPTAASLSGRDLRELLCRILDKLEQKMAGTIVDGYIKALMAGKVRSFICCVNVQYESNRVEDYYDIQLDVKGCKNIYDSFKKYTEIEMVDGENLYEAGEHGKQDARKGVTFESFPPVMMIHLNKIVNFTKIHDHFEFPLRLELDQFLAPDCPEESRQQPNVYLLHSVLVHQGDVCEGHYYAYIRPTTRTFDYTRERRDERDQQWYKFDDETVLQVPQREAAESCYGFQIQGGGLLPSCFSPFMLVYVRESDAPDIMRMVNSEDIPAELNERLDNEQVAKIANQLRDGRNGSFYSINFATEKQVAKFKDYSRYQDFISEKALISIECMRDTTKLGVLLIIADKFGKTPAELRLWEIQKLAESDTFAVTEVVSCDGLQQVANNAIFYAEFVEVDGSAQEHIRYAQNCLVLQQTATELLTDLRHVLSGIEDLHYAENEDPVAGCGIGCGNLPLFYLQQLNTELYDHYSRGFRDLQDKMLVLLKPHYKRLHADQLLTFIKVYDPCDYLYIPALAASADDGLHSVECDTEMDSQRIIATKTRTKPPEYVPIKYLGSCLVNRNAKVTALAKTIDEMLRKANKHFPRTWQRNCIGLRYYTSKGPSCCEIILTGHTFRQSTINDKRSALLYVHIQPLRSTEVVSMDVISWLSYRAFRKTLHIRPFDERDVRILLKCQQKRLDRQYATLSESAMLTPHDGTGSAQAAACEELFSMELSLQSTVPTLIRRIAKKLHINSAHIVLFLVNRGSRGYENKRFEVEPVTLVPNRSFNSQGKVISVLNALKLNVDEDARYCVFYQIVPFPLVDSKGVDLRTQYKFTDFLIVDERVRYWRALYLEHLRIDAPAENYSTNEDGLSAEATPASKLREIAIVWPPAPEQRTYDILEESQVTMCLESTAQLKDVTDSLRDMLGIPKNVHELNPRSSAHQAETGQLLRSPSVRSAILEGKRATCTDELSMAWEGEITPSFPLLLSVIRYDIIDEVLDGASQMYIQCRSEATVPASHLYSVALQHVTAEDAIFMRGKHPRIRSMILSVFSFKLAGQDAVPLPCREYPQGGGPFLSYVRQDDTYESLARRLAAITGDDAEEWCNMRLAIAIPKANSVRKTTVFFSRPQSQPVSTIREVIAATESKDDDFGDEDLMAADEADRSGQAKCLPSESVWEFFCQHSRMPCESGLNALPPIPLLGIQRSRNDPSPAAVTDEVEETSGNIAPVNSISAIVNDTQHISSDSEANHKVSIAHLTHDRAASPPRKKQKENHERGSAALKLAEISASDAHPSAAPASVPLSVSIAVTAAAAYPGVATAALSAGETIGAPLATAAIQLGTVSSTATAPLPPGPAVKEVILYNYRVHKWRLVAAGLEACRTHLGVSGDRVMAVRHSNPAYSNDEWELQLEEWTDADPQPAPPAGATMETVEVCEWIKSKIDFVRDNHVKKALRSGGLHTDYAQRVL